LGIRRGLPRNIRDFNFKRLFGRFIVFV
jgi:hypothetical protein